MKQRALTIDNGGSGLRFISNSDNREVHIIDNNISIINEQDFRIKDGVGQLDIIKIVEAPNDQYKNLFATENGFFMYPGSKVSFTSQTKKADSAAWYQKCIIAIAKDAMNSILREEKEKAVTSLDVPVTEEVEYVLVTLIPLYEHSGATDFVTKIREGLVGDYEVEFPVLNRSVKIKLAPDKIGILPEGAVVVTAMRKEIEPEDYTLVIDMGDNTCDRALFRGTKLVGSAITPSTFAGGTLLRLVGAGIQNNGLASSTDLEIEALNKYSIKIGKRTIDMTEAVDNAKKLFINSYVKNEIFTIVELAGIQASNVTRVIAIGGVLGVENPKTQQKDLLELLMKECNLVNAELVIMKGNPRHINVQRAADFCDLFAKKFNIPVNTIPSGQSNEEQNIEAQKAEDETQIKAEQEEAAEQETTTQQVVGTGV